LSIAAVLSVIFGLFSILTVFGWVFWVIPILALLLSISALKQIKYAPDDFEGKPIAWAGMALALVLAITGGFYDHFNKNVPAGYKAVAFDDLQPNSDNPGEIIPPSAFQLEPTDNEPNRRIFITGYIYPGKFSIGIKEFTLVPRLADCKFCWQQLRSTEMIHVKMTGDWTVDYSLRPVSLGGKLHIDRAQALNPFGGLPYQLDGDYCRE
jgi:hypothetical protein